jgi:type I restriction enzyme M protein
LSSNTSGEGEIRKNIIEADLVDCMVALPGQLFYSTQIPVCLWFLARDKRNHRFRDRREEVRKHGHVLTPGRYVGAAEEDVEPFDEKMRRLTAQLREQQAESRRLDEIVSGRLWVE